MPERSRTTGDEPDSSGDVRALHAVPASGRLVGAPRVSRAHLSRPRLLELLNDAGDVPLRVVQAPAGYGKTSLLAEWVHTRPPQPGHTVWITVDDDSRTRIGFWGYVVGLLTSTGLARGTGFEGFEVTLDYAEVLRPTLIRCFESLPHPLTLVVEAYENISDPRIEADLLRLVRQTANLLLVVSTRTPTTLGSESTALSVDAVLVDARALTFRSEETARLADQLHSSLTIEQIHLFHKASAGWPLAVRAWLQAPRDHPWPSADEHDTLSRVQRLFVDALRDVPGFDDLVLTSVIDGFTLRQAELLGAELGASPILDDVQVRGLGHWEEGAEAPRFRLQPLVREALSALLSDAQLREAHRRLTSWYEERGDYSHAFQSAFVAQDWSRARGYVISSFNEVFENLDRHWLARVDIPRHVLRSEPLLALVIAVVNYAAGNVGKAVRMLTAGVANAQRQGLADLRHVSIEQLFIQAAVVIGLRFAGRDELLQPALARFLKLLPRVSDPHDELRRMRKVIATEIAVTYMHLDRDADAARALADRLPRAHSRRSHDFFPESLAVLVAASAGRIGQAREVLAGLVDYALPRFFTVGYYAVPKHVGAAYVHLEDHRLDAAAEELAHVRPHWPTIESWPLILHAQTFWEWHSVGAADALRTLDGGLDEKKDAPLGAAMHAMLTALRAELLLATSRIAEARQLVPARRTRHYPRLAVAKARSFLMEGDPARALALTAAPQHEHRATPRDQLHLRLIAASASLRSGDDRSARRSFTEAVDLANRIGLRTPFAAMPRDDFRTLSDGLPDLDDLRRDVELFPILFPEPEAIVSLTRRELVVLNELATPATLPVIARRLSVATGTIKSQCRSIYRKLRVSGRDQAVDAARRRGLL